MLIITAVSTPCTPARICISASHGSRIRPTENKSIDQPWELPTPTLAGPYQHPQLHICVSKEKPFYMHSSAWGMCMWTEGRSGWEMRVPEWWHAHQILARFLSALDEVHAPEKPQPVPGFRRGLLRTQDDDVLGAHEICSVTKQPKAQAPRIRPGYIMA